MPDNVELPSGSGGATIHTDELTGSIHVQRTKVGYGEDGEYRDVEYNHPLPVGNPDAFDRLRVSMPYTEFESKLLAADKQTLLWDEAEESGSGTAGTTPTTNLPQVDLSTTLGTAGTRTRQTKRRFGYQSGKSQLIMMTGVMDLLGGGTDIIRRMGYFDDDNGIFLEDDQGTLKFVVRSKTSGGVVDTKVAQSAWSYDTFDGNGPSGITMDWTKYIILVMDFQWLGGGRIRFGFEIDGIFYLAHEAGNSTNSSALPYMSTPNLPLRYQIVSQGAGGAASSMRAICAVVMSEGGSNQLGVNQSHSTGSTHVDCNTADQTYAICGIRLKADQLGAQVEPKSISALVETADAFVWHLCYNPTVASHMSFAGITDSACEGAVANTNNPTLSTVSNLGHIVAQGHIQRSGSADTGNLTGMEKLGAKIDGTRDELWLCVTPMSANADIVGSINWIEEF